MSRYRIKLRSEHDIQVVGTTSDVHARQGELSHFAVSLIREGVTGDLVLVDETTGEEVARRLLLPGDETMGDGMQDAP